MVDRCARPRRFGFFFARASAGRRDSTRCVRFATALDSAPGLPLLPAG
jgi:hypothetical protein